MMDTLYYNFAVEMKESIIPGYNNNKFIEEHMVMLLMVIQKLTSTDT